MTRRYREYLSVVSASILVITTLSGCAQQKEQTAQTALSAQTEQTIQTEQSTQTEQTDQPGQNTALKAITAASQNAENFYKEEDSKTSWDADSAVISCTGTEVSITGTGASEQAGIITINQAGTYVLSGTLDNGQLLINAGKDDLVHLVLNGFSISSPNLGSSPIYGKQSGKVLITLAEGTLNSVTDGAVYTFENAETDEPNAAIFSKDAITINGNGSLSVTGSFEDGIRSKDGLVIMSGTLEITANRHGIKGKDFIYLKDGTVSITAAQDGINSSKDFIMENGNLTIHSKDDGIHADAGLIVYDGILNIPESNEGLEGMTVDLAGGTINITSIDDGINAAMPSDEETTQISEALTDTAPPESDLAGAKAARPEGAERSGGRRTDGMAGGHGPGGEKGSFENNENVYIRILGGTITVDASGDGIDSNGSLYVEGGVLYVSGSEKSGNASLDYNGTASISDGTVIAAGSSGMLQSFSDDSAQNFLVIYLNEMHQGSDLISLTDSAGTILASYTPEKAFSSITVSTPLIKNGETYTVSVGSEISKITVSSVKSESGTPSRSFK